MASRSPGIRRESEGRPTVRVRAGGPGIRPGAALGTYLSRIGITNEIEPRERQSGIGESGRRLFPGCHARAIAESHAREPFGRMVLSKTAGRIQSIRHPSAKVARISSCEILRGRLNSPGSRSLKASMM